MNWFYNNKLYKTQKGKAKNKTGQWTDTYMRSSNFKADVQSAGAALVKKTFGEDIVCSYLVYCDEALNTGEIIVYRDKTYKVIKALPWDYTIAAIQGVDLIVS